MAAESMSDRALRKRLCFLGIKGLPIIYVDDVRRDCGRLLPPKSLLDYIWKWVEVTQIAIAGLTPNEFMTVFPVDKRYDGDRYEVKDYFSTMEELREIGMDTNIGENVYSLLFDYQNRHVRKFNVFKFNVLDCFRACRGEPSIMEAFLAENGIYPESLMTDNDGKRFVYDRSRQTCYPVAKNRPRYLRVINNINTRKEPSCFQKIGL
jgi:hypothetical protein